VSRPTTTRCLGGDGDGAGAGAGAGAGSGDGYRAGVTRPVNNVRLIYV